MEGEWRILHGDIRTLTTFDVSGRRVASGGDDGNSLVWRADRDSRSPGCGTAALIVELAAIGPEPHLANSAVAGILAVWN